MPVRQMTYAPPTRDDGQVEVMSFARLRQLNGGGLQRADFAVLGVVEDGDGAVSVDFGTHRLEPHAVVLVRPGAVHAWLDMTHLVGTIVLFVPTALREPRVRRVLELPSLRAVWAQDAYWAQVEGALRHLELETAATVQVPGVREAVLTALLLRVLRPAPQRGSPGLLFDRFVADVERDYLHHHDAAHYARLLGYGPRTRSRMVLAATGVTAKAFVSDRLALEAKRLLACDGLTSAQCADRLGFGDPASFSMFFARVVGVRPGAWQAANRL